MCQHDQPVLFVAGYGRSGSTLLERFLVMKEETVSVGEMNRIWERNILGGELCGCGSRFSECMFWSEVIRRAFGSPQDAEAIAHRAIALKQVVDRNRFFPRHRFKALQNQAFRSALEEYAGLLRRLLAAVREVSGKSTVIDASKDPVYGYALQAANPNFRLLHLVRDPRAVSYSWSKKKRRTEIVDRVEYMPRLTTQRASFNWLAYNYMAASLARQARTHTTVFYEDFSDAPLEVTARALHALFPEEPAPQAPAAGIADTGSLTHGIGGNPDRFNDSGFPTVRRDDAWKEKMSGSKQAMAYAISAPMLLRLRKDK